MKNISSGACNSFSIQSGLAVGKALKQDINAESSVWFKAGFLSYNYRHSVEPRIYIKEKHFKTGLSQVCALLLIAFLMNWV